MCEPATMMMAATAISAASSVMGGISGLEQGQYQAKIASYNSQMALKNAAAAKEAGDRAETIQRQKTAAMIGTQQAQMAANGQDLSSGSAFGVMSDTAKLGDADALTIRQNYYDRIRSFYTQASDFKAEAEQDKVAGYMALGQGILKAGSTALTGGSDISSKWGGWQSGGGGGGGASPSSDLAGAGDLPVMA